MKNKLHRHLVTCRLCQLEQGHYCHALSGGNVRVSLAWYGFALAGDRER